MKSRLPNWMYGWVVLTGLCWALVAQSSPTQEKAASANSPAKILSQIDALKGKVETIRGLKYKSPFKRGLQSPQDFQTFLKKEIDQEYPPKKLEGWKRWLVQFGFITETVDIKKLLFDLLQEQVIGYYDPEQKQLYLIDKDFTEVLGGGGKLSKEDEAAIKLMQSMGLDIAGMLISHELDHALQDQYFDLTRLKKQREANEDRSTAVSALIEGESTLLMIEYTFKGFGIDATMLPQFGELLDGFSATATPGMAKLDQAPEYFRENLMFPYLQGAKLAYALRKAGGWDLLNQAMRHPPESTTQVLHPEKYWQKRENPTIISLADLQSTLGNDWQRLEENSLGELNISILARKFLPKETARTLGEGWSGDTFQLFEHKKTKATALVWYTTWNSVDRAKNFYSGYRALLEKKTNQAVLVERKDTDVAVIEGLAEPLTARVLTKVWQSKKQPLNAPALTIAN